MLPVYSLHSSFLFGFKTTAKNAEIYNLKILYHAVTSGVESPKPRRVVIKCWNCQEYGAHKKNLPQKGLIREMRRLALLTMGSTIPVTSLQICTYCMGDHTANYKGCPVHTA
jgi:hypothetical protein